MVGRATEVPDSETFGTVRLDGTWPSQKFPTPVWTAIPVGPASGCRLSGCCSVVSLSISSSSRPSLAVYWPL